MIKPDDALRRRTTLNTGNVKMAGLCKFFGIALVGIFTVYSQANATIIGATTPYVSTADSPFDGLAFDYFHLDDIEDDLLNTPGVSASAGAPRNRVAEAGLIDSVDADDGAIDGSGLDGNSFHISIPSDGTGPLEIVLSFSALDLGALPTHAGLVLKDISDGTTATFEAFDNLGGSLGSSASSLSSTEQGVTDEDQFFGAINASGISAISIRLDIDVGGGFELDHIQYGRISRNAVPEPGTLAIFALCLAGPVCTRRCKSVVR